MLALLLPQTPVHIWLTLKEQPLSGPSQLLLTAKSIQKLRFYWKKRRDIERGGVRSVQTRDSLITVKITLHLGLCRVNTAVKLKKTFSGFFVSLITGDLSLTKSRIGTNQSARRDCTIITIPATGILLVFRPCLPLALI